MKKSSYIKQLIITKSISRFDVTVSNKIFLQMPFAAAVKSVKVILKFGSKINYKFQDKWSMAKSWIPSSSVIRLSLTLYVSGKSSTYSLIENLFPL